MYAQADAGWWGMIYDRIRHAIEFSGYGAVRRIEKIVKSYATGGFHEKYADAGSKPSYKSPYTDRYSASDVRSPYDRLYAGKETVKEIEIANTVSNAREFVLQESITVRESVSDASFAESVTLKNTGPEDIGTKHDTAADRPDAQTAFDLLDGFEKTAETYTASLPERQFSLLLEKIKKTEDDVTQAKRSMLAMALLFLTLICALFFIFR